MGKTKLKLFFLFCTFFLAFPSACFSQYFINNFEIWNGTGADIKGDGSKYCKVTFNGDSNLGITSKTIYVERGETITLEDAPKISYNDGFIQRTSGNVILSINNQQNENIVVNNDLNFVPTVQSFNNQIPANEILIFDKVNTDYRGDSVVSAENENGRQVINVNEGANNSSGNLINYGEFNSNLNVLKNFRINLNVYFNGGDKQESNWGGSRVEAVNGDTTISLEDKNSEVSDYKPLANDSNKNKNYCANRINLSNDLLLLNSYIAVGARNGAYGSNPEFFQINYQNFIIGQYSEIDLCGHYLIIGSGSEIWAVGSITNSKPERGGVIVESGGNLETTFTVEDHNHEKSLPIRYIHGDTAFNMYRCPYFNVKAVFYPGCNYQLGMKIFFGPSQGYSYNEVNVFGGSDPIFSLNNGNVVRECFYDEEIKSAIASKDANFGINNILYQKISYSFYDCNNCDVNLPMMETEILSGINLQLGKDNFYIPPYLSIYLFNSQVNIYNKYVFLPGSYLYVDEMSSICFSYKDVSYIDSTLLSFANANVYYQQRASLEFLSTMFDISEATAKWVDDTDAGEGNGSKGNERNVIHTLPDTFWSFLSNYRWAECDMYGTFTFNKNTNNLVDNYSIGGRINIYYIDKFIAEVEGFNRINFYVNNFLSAAGNFKDINIGNYRFNIFQFNFLPLISFGHVIVNPLNAQTILNINEREKYVFDDQLGVIKDENNSEFYAFVYSNENNDHLNRSGYNYRLIAGDRDFRNGTTNLEGNIYKVNYNQEHCSITSSSFQGEYVYFHGKFVSATSITGSKSSNNLNATLNLSKFRYGGSFGGGMSSRAATFSNSTYYGYSCRRLS